VLLHSRAHLPLPLLLSELWRLQDRYHLLPLLRLIPALLHPHAHPPLPLLFPDSCWLDLLLLLLLRIQFW
jgi:hypothetical protein